MRMEGRKMVAAGEELEKAEKLDLSGMSLDALPNTPVNLASITKLDLSNNNLEVSFLSTRNLS